MTTPQPPILRTAVVNRPLEEAFTVFTDQIGAWWPLPTHSLFQSDAGGVHFADGRLVERAIDGRATVWAEVLVWEPPTKLVLAWHPGAEPDSSGSAPPAGRVEVTFTEEQGATRVDLRHDGWEAYGSTAGQQRRGYVGPSAWGHVLDHFADGVEARLDGAEPEAMSALAAAYESFLAEADDGAARGAFGPPPEGEWTAEQVVAHVALTDLAMSAVGHALIHQSQPVFDNRICQAIEHLDSIVAEFGDLDRLIAFGRRCAAQALATAQRLDPEQRARDVACRLDHDGASVVDAAMPWGQVAIEIQAANHLPGHTRQLRQLRTD